MTDIEILDQFSSGVKLKRSNWRISRTPCTYIKTLNSIHLVKLDFVVQNCRLKSCDAVIFQDFLYFGRHIWCDVKQKHQSVERAKLRNENVTLYINFIQAYYFASTVLISLKHYWIGFDCTKNVIWVTKQSCHYLKLCFIGVFTNSFKCQCICTWTIYGRLSLSVSTDIRQVLLTSSMNSSKKGSSLLMLSCGITSRIFLSLITDSMLVLRAPLLLIQRFRRSARER